MTYEAWRITYQSSESAARAAYASVAKLNAENEKLKAELKAITAALDDAMKGETCYQNTSG